MDAIAWLAAFDRHTTGEGMVAALNRLIAEMTAARPDAVVWCDVADGLFARGAFDGELALLDQALRTVGEHAALRYRRGNALRVLGRIDEAEAAFREALARAPALRDAAYSLAYMLRERGRTNAAAHVIVDLWRTDPARREIAIGALEFLRECGAFEAAVPIATDVAQRWPDDAASNALAGETLLAVGDFTAATPALRRAAAARPASWLRIVQCRRYTDERDADIGALRGLTQSRDDNTRICTRFALGKIFDDLGRFADAASVLVVANATAAARQPWNSAAWTQEVESVRRARALPPVRVATDFTPVFIVGLPRSGTTLLALRLAQHAQVRDRGELHWIGALHSHLRERGQLQDPAALASVGTIIAAQMRRDDAPAQFVIDKNPLNFRHLAFIEALFPDARILHCRRGLRDCSLSIWQQYFAHPDLAFSYRFESIAAFANGYRQIIGDARARSRLRWLDVDYEQLVGDEHAALQRISEFLDLSGESTIAATTAITTASVWQARQPVYTRSIGRWRRYAPFVAQIESLFPADVQSGA